MSVCLSVPKRDILHFFLIHTLSSHNLSHNTQCTEHWILSIFSTKTFHINFPPWSSWSPWFINGSILSLSYQINLEFAQITLVLFSPFCKPRGKTMLEGWADDETGVRWGIGSHSGQEGWKWVARQYFVCTLHKHCTKYTLIWANSPTFCANCAQNTTRLQNVAKPMQTTILCTETLQCLSKIWQWCMWPNFVHPNHAVWNNHLQQQPSWVQSFVQLADV